MSTIGRRIVERRDLRQGGEERADALPLRPDSLAVDQPHLAQAALPCRLEVGANNLDHLAGREGMEIDRVFDRHDVRFFDPRLLFARGLRRISARPWHASPQGRGDRYP